MSSQNETSIYVDTHPDIDVETVRALVAPALEGLSPELWNVAEETFEAPGSAYAVDIICVRNPELSELATATLQALVAGLPAGVRVRLESEVPEMIGDSALSV